MNAFRIIFFPSLQRLVSPVLILRTRETANDRVQGGCSLTREAGLTPRRLTIRVERVWQKESAFELTVFVFYQRGSFCVTHN